MMKHNNTINRKTALLAAAFVVAVPGLAFADEEPEDPAVNVPGDGTVVITPDDDMDDPEITVEEREDGANRHH